LTTHRDQAFSIDTDEMTNEASVRTRNDVSIIDIRGDVTPNTGGPIEDTYKQLTVAGSKKILICFDRDGYINSGGIAVLIGIVSESRKRGQLVRMTGLSAHFQKIFSMVGLAKYARVFPSEDAALADF
jgi:anti-anti-sigma factor